VSLLQLHEVSLAEGNSFLTGCASHFRGERERWAGEKRQFP